MWCWLCALFAQVFSKLKLLVLLWELTVWERKKVSVGTEHHSLDSLFVLRVVLALITRIHVFRGSQIHCVHKKAPTDSSVQFFVLFFIYKICIKILCTRPRYQGSGNDSHACTSYIILPPVRVLWAEVQFYRLGTGQNLKAETDFLPTL